MKFKQILLGMSFACIVTYAQAQVKVGANPGTITTNGVLDVEGTSGQHTVILQNGNMGVNTTEPGSTLTSAGSFAANYKEVTAGYTMVGTDHFVSYNGGGAGTITLPPAAAVGSGNFKGRIYTIKNTTAAQTLTVAADGSETIDGVASLTIASEYAVQVISTGATSGKTWEVVSLSPTSVKPPVGFSTVYNVVATAPVTVAMGTGNTTNDNVNLGLSKAITIPASTKALVTVLYSVPAGIAFVPSTSQTIPSTYLGVRFLRNSTEEPAGSRKFTMPGAGRLGFSVTSMSTITGVYSEVVTSGASATTVTYDPRGYIEQNANPSNLSYTFNMAAASGPNFNWGKAAMVITVTYF